MLYSRLVSTFVLVPTIIFILFFSSITQFLFFLLIICLIGSWEWGKLMRFSLNMQCIWMCAVFILLFSLIIPDIRNYLYSNFWCIFFSISSIVIIWWVLACFLVLFYPHSAVFWNRSNVLRFCFGIFMIFPFFLAVLVLHQLNIIIPNVSERWWLLYVLILVWINDISAYFIGKKWGKHKLLKNVSPKKTWEGCIGGVLISIGTACIFIKYIIIDVINLYIVYISFIGSILFAVIGDLTESMFKRDSGVKDTNNLIPGHGGVLDRIDSLCAAIPVFAILMLFLIYITL